MLQQTRAATVAPFFRRWMDRFPSLEALAAADEQEVLAAWEGLGYYRRARALHRAAREVVARGRLPVDEEGWRTLPGVGPYTAAAVAALAYGHRTVAVDGNVRRVGARLLARPAPRDAELRAALLPLVPETAPALGVEALIELGATVCTPRAPDCAACPLQPACVGAASGEPRRWPAAPRRAPTPSRRRWASAWLDGERVWLERRPPDGLLGGLWGLPQRDAPPPGRTLPGVRHAYSHFRLELVPVVREGPAPSADGGHEGRWVGPNELSELPLSVVDRAVLRRLAEAGLLASTE
jgi:A/G-specific adenine glycosylase